MKTVLRFLALLCIFQCESPAAETAGDMEAAVRKGLAMVKRAASNWQKNKTCFSCHHQTLPLLAMTGSERAGLPVEATWIQSQADTTHRYFEERIEQMDEGEQVLPSK